LLCHEAQNATELGNNNPVIIRKMCRTISSEQKKSVDPYSSEQKKSVDPIPVGKKICRSISSFDKKKAFFVDPFLLELSTHF
jgi:hypothetical protein